MATYYWRSAVNAGWTSNNWSLTDGGGLSGTYPQAADTAVFKASSGQGPCYLDAARTITKLDMRSDYTGTFSGATYNFTINGDCILAGTTVWLGSATNLWTVAGHFNYLNVSNFVPGTCTVKLTGTSKTLTNAVANRYFYNLEIWGTITTVNATVWHNSLTIKANKSLTLGADAGNYNLGAVRQSKLYLESGADFNLNGKFCSWFTPGTGGIASMASTARFRNGTMQILYPDAATGYGVWTWGATYGWEAYLRLFGPAGAGQFTFANQVCKMYAMRVEIRSWNAAGSMTLKPAGNATDVQFSSWVATYSDATNTGFIKFDNTGASGNYWRFASDVYDWMQTGAGASRQWTAVAEYVYASGTLARTWDFTNWTVRVVQIYATSGTVTMDSDLTTSGGFDLGQGTFDANDYDLYIYGGFYARAGTAWTLSSSTVINMVGTSVGGAIQATPRVDPIVINRTGAGGVTQFNDVHTSGLTLTDGTWTGNGYDLETHAGLWKGPDACNLGTGNVTVWAGLNITGMTADAGTITFAGSQTLTFGSAQNILNLTINAGITCTLAAGRLDVHGDLDVLAGGTMDTSTSGYVYAWYAARVYLRTGAVWDGDSGLSLLFHSSYSGAGLILNEGFYNADGLRFYQCASGTRWAPGVYNQNITYLYGGGDCYVKPDAGVFNFAGAIQLYNGAGNGVFLDMTNDPTWRIAGYVNYGGGLTSSDVTWTVSSETLEFDGSTIQGYGWAHEVGNVIVDNSGVLGSSYLDLTTGAHLHCKNLTGTDGGIDTNGRDVTVEGDCILDFDALNASGGTWNLWGNFDWKDVGTWAVGGGINFIMNGTSKYLLGITANPLAVLTVPAGKSAYVHASTSGSVEVGESANVSGTLTVASGLDIGIAIGADIQVETTGTVNGSGDVIFRGVTAGTGLILVGSYTYAPGRTWFYNPTTTSLIPVGNYGGSVRVESTSGTTTWRPGTGTYNITGYLLFNAANGTTLNVDNRYAQPAFVVGTVLYLRGNATGTLNVRNNHATLPINWNIGSTSTYHNNTFNWFKGTGTITFQGGSDRFIDFWDNSVEDIVENKTGGTLLSLNYHTICESLTITSGDFDAATYDMTVGDVDISTTGSMDFGNGSTWAVSGSFDTHLQSGTHTGGDAAFEFSGSGKILWARSAQYYGTVWMKSGSSYTQNATTMYTGKSGDATKTLTIDGTVTGAGNFFHWWGPIHLNASGNLSNNYLSSYRAQSGGGIATWAGTYNPTSGTLYLRDWYNTGVLTPGNYRGSANNVTTRMYSANNNSVFKFSAGTYTFQH